MPRPGLGGFLAAVSAGSVTNTTLCSLPPQPDARADATDDRRRKKNGQRVTTLASPSTTQHHNAVQIFSSAIPIKKASPDSQQGFAAPANALRLCCYSSSRGLSLVQWSLADFASPSSSSSARTFTTVQECQLVSLCLLPVCHQHRLLVQLRHDL